MGVQFAGNILVQANGGPLPIVQGGTGQTTATGARTALLPVQTGQNGKVLATNGTDVFWSSGGAGTPGGSDTQIQFNDSGAFGGIAALTVNKSTGALTSGSTVTGTGFVATAPAGTARPIKFLSGSSERWILQTNGVAESGGNAGSNFELVRVADNGSTQNQVFTVARSSGVVDFKQTPTVNGVAIGGGTYTAGTGLTLSGNEFSLTTPVAPANLGSGTANSTTFLRGDGTWATPTATAAAGSLTGTTLASNVVSSSLTSVGTITSGTWSGSFGAVSGANLTSLNASNLSSGTVGTARLGSGTANSTTFLRGDGSWAVPTASANVLFGTGSFASTWNASQTAIWAGNKIGGSAVAFSNSSATANNRLAFLQKSSDGSLQYYLTNDDDSASSSVFSIFRSGNTATQFNATATAINLTGAVTGTSFSGSGAGLTSLDADNISSGTVVSARLGTGTANSSTYLRGDGTWAAVSAGAATTLSATGVSPRTSATTGVYAGVVSGAPIITVTAAGAAAGNRVMQITNNNSGTIAFEYSNDAISAASQFINVTRVSGTNDAATMTLRAGNFNMSAVSTSATGIGGATTLASAPGGSTSGAGGALNLNAGSAGGSGAGGTVTVTAGSAVTAGAGGGVALNLGAGAGASAAGSFSVVGAQGGATGGGSAVSIVAGNGGATSGAGGNVVLNAGSSTTSGAGGNVTITTGTGAANGASGTLALTLGASAGSGTAGPFNITGGQGGTTGVGSTFNWTSGNGGSTSGNSGAIIIQSGASNSNTGAITIRSVQPATTGTSGAVSLTSGNGGATSGASGSAVVATGDTVSGAVSGNLTLRTGGIGAGNFTSGTVTINTGDSPGSVNSGNIDIYSGSSSSLASGTGHIFIRPQNGNGLRLWKDGRLTLGEAAINTYGIAMAAPAQITSGYLTIARFADSTAQVDNTNRTGSNVAFRKNATTNVMELYNSSSTLSFPTNLSAYNPIAISAFTLTSNGGSWGDTEICRFMPAHTGVNAGNGQSNALLVNKTAHSYNGVLQVAGNSELVGTTVVAAVQPANNTAVSGLGALEVRANTDTADFNGTTTTVRIRSTNSTTASVYFQNSATGTTATDGTQVAAEANGIDSRIWNYENGFVRIATANTERLRVTNGGIVQPGADNTQSFGTGALRWSTIFAGTGTINTSDVNEKQDIASLSVAEQRVAFSIKNLIKKFRFKSAVAEKGNAARIHVGVIAQEVQQAFIAEDLDPTMYGIFCSDTWIDEQGIERTRMGIRYDELLAFVIASI